MGALTSVVRSARIRRVVRVALPALVVAYAAILRFDAITQMYGPADRPGWLHTVQVHGQAPLRWLRPARLTWPAEGTYPHRDGPATRYYGDPYTYLRYAREMSSFYAAHSREPGYPFVTKVFLRLLDDQDVAVSIGSAFFSVLLVLATYLLGSLAFSRWVGLAAALAMAIEADVISWSALGGRDDFFTFTVVMFAYALLKYMHEPSRNRAILTGVAAGAACLVRITAPSFILPALAYGLVTTKRPWPERLRHVGLSALVMAVIVAPYVINCWRTFGRPFYAIDGPASVYETAEGQTAGPTAATYVWTKTLARPFQTLDTVAEGMTSYPFNNKWHGFDPWLPALGVGLSWAALVGLLLFAGSEAGRALLVVLATSLVPYSVTWKLSSEWRLTEVAYPFFLIAAFFAIGWLAGWANPARVRGLRAITGARWRRLVWFWVAVLAAIAVGRYFVFRVLPAGAVKERLAAREEVTIVAGNRDAPFFGEGWSKPRGNDVVTFRDARGPSAVVWLPLPEAADYSLTIRLDPFPRPAGDTATGLPTVRVLLNRTLVDTFPLRWNPARVGGHDLELPRAVVREGFNRMEIVADGSATPGEGRGPVGSTSPVTTFSIWYIRVRPAVARTP